MIIEIQSFPTPNKHRAVAPCNPQAHFYRVDERSESLLTPILYCPVCGWTYEEIVKDKALCTYKAFLQHEGVDVGSYECQFKRVKGTARCAAHQDGSEEAR